MLDTYGSSDSGFGFVGGPVVDGLDDAQALQTQASGKLAKADRQGD